jgi:hypothetical protein
MTKGRANRQKTVAEQMQTKTRSIPARRLPRVAPAPRSDHRRPERKQR